MKSDLLLICVTGICLFAACRPKPPPAQTPTSSTAAATAKQAYFDVARDYLGRLDEFDPKQGMIQTAYYLNRWIAGSQREVTWRPDPMIQELPADSARPCRSRRWTSGSSRWITYGTSAKRLGLVASRNGLLSGRKTRNWRHG